MALTCLPGTSSSQLETSFFGGLGMSSRDETRRDVRGLLALSRFAAHDIVLQMQAIAGPGGRSEIAGQPSPRTPP
jgi:hypothetical protein